MSLRALAEPEYHRLAARLAVLEMNTLFARAVLERDAPGRVLADANGAVYVIHGYGMSLLFGGTPNDEVLAEVTATPRADAEWLQVSGAWAPHFEKLAFVEKHTRVNFTFSEAAFRGRRPRAHGQRIVRVGHAAFAMAGSVVPRAFWRAAGDFVTRGAGYAVMIGEAMASLAFSAFVTPNQLEIGIETLPEYRGRGLAALACAALVDHCLARGVEPVWACRLDNTASHRLAESLGFAPTRRLPYFRVPSTEARECPPRDRPPRNLRRRGRGETGPFSASVDLTGAPERKS